MLCGFSPLPYFKFFLSVVHFRMLKFLDYLDDLGAPISIEACPALFWKCGILCPAIPVSLEVSQRAGTYTRPVQMCRANLPNLRKVQRFAKPVLCIR